MRWVSATGLCDPFPQYDLNMTVVNSSLPLIVTLTWYDPAPSILSSKLLVNDLDLTVTHRSGEFRYGAAASVRLLT